MKRIAAILIAMLIVLAFAVSAQAFPVFGGEGVSKQLTGDKVKTGTFKYLQPNGYWPGAEYAWHPADAYMLLSPCFYEPKEYKVASLLVVGDGPVNDDGPGNGNGEVKTNVPEAGIMLLLGSGLVGLAMLRNKLK